MATTTQNSRVLTLVFSDLVGSTALKAEKGDDAAGALIARHREHVKSMAYNMHATGEHLRRHAVLARRPAIVYNKGLQAPGFEAAESDR